MVKLVCESIGLAYVILRYQNVYGAGQSLRNPYTGILSIFSTQILNGNSLNIFEDGLMTRDFIHIKDTVEATVKCLEMETANNAILNIGTGIATPVLSVAKLLMAAYQKNVPMEVSGDFRIGDIRHHFADLTKMNTLLNVQPKVNLDEGIPEFANWVLEQPPAENNLLQSLQEMKEKGFLKT